MPVSLARAWTRQLYGASGAVLLVPGALVAALLVLGLAGGFGGLGALAQTFAGPSVPAAARIATARTAAHRTRALPVAVAVAPAATPGSGLANGGPAPGAATSRIPAGQGIGSTGLGHGRASAPRGGIWPGSGAGQVGYGGSGPGGSGSGTQSSTLLDNVVNLGTSITKQLPGPVGGLTTQLLQSLAKTVDGIVPRTQRPATPASPVTGVVKGVTNGLHLP